MKSSDTRSCSEISRLRAEYSRRDAAGLSRIYSYSNPAFTFHMQEREWAILNLLRESRVDIAGFRILEVGCGTGHILERFLEFGAGKAVGIDLADHRIKIAKTKYPNLLFLHGNAAELPFRENAFDLVMQFMCMSSVLEAATRQQIADEMWRVVRPGGVILYYDLRTAPHVSRILFPVVSIGKKILARILSRPGLEITGDAAPPPTPIHCLDRQELTNFFPKGLIRYRAVSLNYELAGISGVSLLTAQLLSRIPFLRTHYLAIIRKPP